IDMGWNRGEAWVITDAARLKKNRKSVYRIILSLFPEMIAGFRRVQATCFSGNTTLIRHLGFRLEAELKDFGPQGETGKIFVL
ncbi:MAG: hypothetical protein N3A02_06035, partial [Rectinema sp.]|nr:hypothetical protein [Rectinema sp.]